MQKTSEKQGTLEVICGSMFSGKSEELIRRLKRAQLAQQHVVVFKHHLDDRETTEYIVSHNGTKLKGFPISDAQEISLLIPDEVTVVGIDEIQFFSPEIISVICDLVNSGKRVLAAGLDLDFKGIPFGPMPMLLAIADHVTKLKAICMTCGKEAHYTQRLVNEQPAKHNDPLILIGAQESYQARCRNCYQIDKMPNFSVYEQTENSL